MYSPVNINKHREKKHTYKQKFYARLHARQKLN